MNPPNGQSPHKNEEPFAAMRRACGPEAETETTRADILRANAIARRRPAGLSPREAARILYSGMPAVGRAYVCERALRSQTISWRMSRRDWFSVRRVTVAPGEGGVIWLRNDIIPSIPRQVWPWLLPSVQSFRLMVHWSEITSEVGAELFEFCSSLGNDGGGWKWPLFSESQTYPGYAWTRKARIAFEERNKRL